MSLFDPSQPLVIHQCQDCREIMRQRDRWPYALELEGGAAVNDFIRWYHEHNRTEPYRIERGTVYEGQGYAVAAGTAVGGYPHVTEDKTVIRSPCGDMLALAKLFITPVN